MKLMVSTNPNIGKLMLEGEFNEIIWASDNLETVAHYYEGCVIELDIKLDRKKHIGYIRCFDDIEELYNITLDGYTYGMMRTRCPENARWYSFSASYIKEHLKGIREIYPDLSEWNEEEEI